MIRDWTKRLDKILFQTTESEKIDRKLKESFELEIGSFRQKYYNFS